MNDPRAALVFPPLVETNFGRLYPSTAVLAAFLESRDIATTQLDLNEDLALYLLRTDVLRRMGSGVVTGVTPDSYAAAAARWIASRRELLLLANGRHDIGPEAAHGHVVRTLARPFLMDASAQDLTCDLAADFRAAFMDEFYTDVLTPFALPGSIALVGVSVAMGPQLLPALILAHHLKKIRSDIRVVLGGPALSLMALSDLDTLLSRHHHWVDAVVRFDGELPLLELARQACTGRWEPARTAGVSSISGGQVYHAPPAGGLHPNALPAPCYAPELVDRLTNPVLGVTQARGCYWGKCDYCDFIELYDGSPKFRGRAPEKFVDELAHLVATYGINRFTFVTESIPPAFAQRMSALVCQRGLGIEWDSFAMVDRRFTKELFELMAMAGCEALIVGLETMITRVLQLVHKSATGAENRRFLHDAHKVGLKLHVNIIPDLPSTTYPEALQALGELEDLSDCFEQLSLFPFEATRSSNIGRNPGVFGLVPLPTNVDSGQAQYQLNHLDNCDPAMTPDEREDIMQRYRQFVATVNTRHIQQMPLSAWPTAPDGATETWQLAAEDVDVYRDNSRVVCTNVRTAERITIRSLLTSALEDIIAGAPFTVGLVRYKVGGVDGSRLMRNLAEAQIIVPAASGNARIPNG